MITANQAATPALFPSSIAISATRTMHGMFPHHPARVVRNAAPKLAIQSIRHKKNGPG
jgi:hypothetical protein